jgi:hypothetical protein
MTTKTLSPVEERSLVPLGGALVKGSDYRYNIQLVASKKYYGRPFYEFTSEQVLIDEKKGVLQFTARPAAIQNFIWNMVIVKDGKGNPVGLYTDVYIEAYRKTKKFATALITGHIITCNNVGHKVGYVIRVQANSEIKVTYYD